MSPSEEHMNPERKTYNVEREAELQKGGTIGPEAFKPLNQATLSTGGFGGLEGGTSGTV